MCGTCLYFQKLFIYSQILLQVNNIMKFSDEIHISTSDILSTSTTKAQFAGFISENSTLYVPIPTKNCKDSNLFQYHILKFKKIFLGNFNCASISKQHVADKVIRKIYLYLPLSYTSTAQTKIKRGLFHRTKQ